jgi:phage terminase large subunit-like protein
MSTLEELCVDEIDVELLKEQLDLLARPDTEMITWFAQHDWAERMVQGFSAEEAEALSGVLNMCGEMVARFEGDSQAFADLIAALPKKN